MKSKTKLIFLLIILVSVFSLAAEEIFVILSDCPPWKIITKDPVTKTIYYSGIDVDILKAISEITELEFTFEVAPWKRAIELFKIGKVDIITNYSETSQRKEFSLYVQPYYHSRQVALYTNKESGIVLKNFEDLSNYNIGIVSGSAYFDQFDNNLSLRKEEVIMETQLRKMLATNRIDIAIGWEITFDFSLMNSKDHGQIIKSPFYPLTELPKDKAGTLLSHFAFSKKSDKIKYFDEFQEALQIILNNGTVTIIIAKYWNPIRENNDYKQN